MLLSWGIPVERLLAEVSEKAAKLPVAPVADVLDTGDAYRIVVELPGVASDAVKIDLENGTLTVRGERAGSGESKAFVANGRLAERPFERTFHLGDDIDRARIAARLENGLLTLTLPRREEEKPTRIEVQAG